MTTIDRLCVAVEAGSVQPGDEILVKLIGLHLVAEVNRYDDRPDDVVIVYFAHEEQTFENKARDKSGGNPRRRIVMKSMKIRPASDTVLVVRGSAGAAATVRAQLEREQKERWHAKQERRDRAQMYEEREKTEADRA